MQQFDNLLAGRVPWLALRGDALEVLAALPAGSVDAFASDPPYGLGLKLGTAHRETRIRGDGKHEARLLWERFVPLAARAAKPDSAHVFFGTWKSPWMADVLADSFAVKHCVVWVKPHWGLGRYMRPRWELAYVVHKGRPPVPAKADCDVWEQARDNLTLHPCRKPVPLMRRALRTVLPAEHRAPGYRPLVVDPFAGTFATGVAALAEGCRFLGVELDPGYHPAGVARMEAACTTAGPAPVLRLAA